MNNKNKSLSYLPGLLVVVFIWFGIAAWSMFKPVDEFSDSERRELAKFPEVTIDSVLSGKFMSDFETYTLDQFPMRDTFRTIKAMSAFYLFGKSDNNGIYIKDGYAAKVEYPLNDKSVNSAADKFTALYEKNFKDKNVNVYLTVVPDKGYFLAEKHGYPALDYQKLVSIMKEKMPYAQYIDIMNDLSVEDYYKTDTHWRQENITDVAEKIAGAMNTGAFDSFEEIKTDVPFYGVYYGQAALPLPFDDISYLTNDILKDCAVSAFDSHTNKVEKVEMYSEKHLNGKDPYEMFLYGATPYVCIENPHGEKDKELVIFRDSFGSSISPLLVKDYSKVTLLDTRYMAPEFVGNFIGSSTDDVLFLYSTLILNSSDAIR